MKYIILKGGLGNQLFQLSKFLDLINNKNLKNLKIDVESGFLIDYKYRRNLEIDQIKNKKYSTITFFSILNLFLIFIDRFIPFIAKMFRVLIINDDFYLKEHNYKRKYIIFNGYFQNYKYVKNNDAKLFSIIKPNFERGCSLQFQELYEEINNYKNSIALGIRFYEESKNPGSHLAHNSSLKSVRKYNDLIKYFEKYFNDIKFFIFVQNENNFTEDLAFNSSHKFISHSKGYIGSWERLKAQSLCKHHIFNNSTFYYWGALFSKYLNKDNGIGSQIYISNNFKYKEIYNPDWKKF